MGPLKAGDRVRLTAAGLVGRGLSWQLVANRTGRVRRTDYPGWVWVRWEDSKGRWFASCERTEDLERG